MLIVLLFLLFLLFLKYPRSSYTPPEVYKDLITPQEGEYIIKKAQESFISSETLAGMDKNIRNSEQSWINKNDPVVKEIYRRLSEQFNFNVENAESLQVVKYQPGGFYKPHHDACCDDNELCDNFKRRSGQRIMTILIYLNNDFEEGETSFPNLDLKLKPPTYGGVVFYTLNKDKKCETTALHSGTPVKSGIKYACNIWVREFKFA